MPSHSSSSTVTPAFSAKALAGRREKLNPACIARMRELVEGTGWSYKRIAEEIGVSLATVSRYVAQEGWQRPPGAAVPARIGNHRERVTQKLWKLTERHAQALEDQPIELAQRSLQPLARLTRVLGDIDKLNPRPAPLREEAAPAPEAPPGRTLHELRDELQAHLDRIMEEEGYGWEMREWWFEDGAGI
ncbi:helix-turn-helix domain-containing protein [Microvirga sp. G4-2]|uniref:helix-turn-helix domain-containing protein n=1 Tax=Microvirga sp. G4-2 TaxID=3434467 RepID=UPI004044AEDC